MKDSGKTIKSMALEGRFGRMIQRINIKIIKNFNKIKDMKENGPMIKLQESERYNIIQVTIISGNYLTTNFTEKVNFSTLQVHTMMGIGIKTYNMALGLRYKSILNTQGISINVIYIK